MIPEPRTVVVVGAGVIGAVIAFHLARRGVRVTLVEREAPGEGASASSFAWINAAATEGSQAYYRLRLQSLFEYRRLEDELSLPIARGGRLEWRDDFDTLEKESRELALLGYPIRTMGRDEVRAMEPELLVPPERAVFAELEGAVAPVDMVRRLLDAARGLGATLHEGRPVNALSVEEGAVTGVKTANGRIRADRVVLAAGIGSEALAAGAGVSLPTDNKPGLLVYTRPSAPLLGRVVLAPDLHMRQESDGRIVAGRDFGGGPVPNDPWAEGERLLDDLNQRLRTPVPLELDNVSVGIRPVPRDGFPVVGFTPALAGLYIAVMHSGITLAPAIGRLAATEILDGLEVELLAPFRPSRFGAG